MYRILIHKPTMPKGSFQFLTIIETVEEHTEDSPSTITKITKIWETDEMEELEAKYLELLETYPKEQLKPIDDLTVSLFVNIKDETE